jgi:hypothetical protein
MREQSERIELEFAKLGIRWRSLVDAAGWPSRSSQALIRSAAKVEQAFGGLNSQLWDDPFEWTLPEALGSEEKAREYFDEVDKTRREGMARIRSDEDLTREIWTPAGFLTLSDLLSRTLKTAEELVLEAELLADK